MSSDLSASDAQLSYAMQMLSQIREALVCAEELVPIPVRAALVHLPPALRGPAWQAQAPADTMTLARDAVLAQLAKGSITFPLEELQPYLPTDWVVGPPETPITLDLPTVVSAIPTAWFGSAAQPTAEVLAASRMRDYFQPRAATEAPPPPPAAKPSAPPPPPEPTPVPAPMAATEPSAPPMPEPPAAPIEPVELAVPAAAQQKKSVPPAKVPGGWDGIETQRDAAAATVDINRAGIDELLTLPGMGRSKAEAILRDRAAHGPFDGIYDLGRVTGVGRKFFAKLTGLSLNLRERRNRHAVLLGLLGLPAEASPSLAQLIEAAVTALPAAACVLADEGGLPLAAGGLPAEEAARFAALVPPFFRKVRRPLRRFAPDRVQALMLPFAAQPLLLLRLNRFFLLVTLRREASLDEGLRKAETLARELEWLLSPRAVVGPR